MSAHLIGVTALGGVPLFSRQVGQRTSEQGVPFATLAALNGVNLFSRLNDANLQTTETKNSKIRWKVFKGNIVLILLATTNTTDLEVISEKCVQNMLELIFEALVLCCGLDEVVGQNIERLKRSLKLAYPLVDHLLLQLLRKEAHFNIVTETVNYTYIDGHTNDFMTTMVESYAQLAQSDFALVLVNGRIFNATKGWWTRISHSRDAMLVMAMVASIMPSLDSEMNNVKETPIYLPENCPNSVTRLITARIYQDIVLVVLCGEVPPLEFLVSEGLTVMKESDIHQEHFRKVHMLRNGSAMAIDEHILGIVLIKGDVKILTRYGNFDEAKIKDMLIMMDMVAAQKNLVATSAGGSSKTHESYAKFRLFQGFKIIQEQHQMYILFPHVLSLNDLRQISLQTLTIFKDKKIWPRMN